ncbi:outer membrane protein transport protein [Methylophaga sp.]|jgi:long-chain fatty acid transport protein|uniref:OmpP1/FadL family transporter n=1 Tax=Methylophaga sp. TaxID=2024840 RepID=UPI001401565D|nr:outer membrane protein transport protein [Methylophaga sp.]MTI62376.1 transporter [Methylophaga sp.]
MNSKLKNISALILIGSLPQAVSAAGFAIKEQSVTSLGRAFAGSAAVAEDASTIFFNPAGLTYLKRGELDMGLNYIKPQSEFRNEGSSVPDFGGFGGFSGQPLTGGDGGDAGHEAFVPNFYLSHPVNDKISLGLGVSAPFGLVTEYRDDWVGRYFAVKSEMLTLNFNPTIAIKATDKLSLGFGVSAQYIDVKLTQMADLGARAGFPQAADGKVKLGADDWGYGYNLGLIYQATDTTRVGLSFRSKISHTLEGDGTLKDANGNTLVDDNVEADVDLPETLSLAIHHQINSKWSVSADATLTRWNRFSELNIKSDGGQLSSIKPEDWENSMRYGLGLSYQHNDKWQFRTGVAYDETPIPNSERRTARIPGTDRKWVAFGASYHYSDNIVIDAAYAHLFMDDPSINETDDNGYNLRGEYDASVDIVGLQLRWLM